MFSNGALSTMIDAQAVNLAKLHNGDPGAAGTSNELTGGSYASKAVTFGAASNGVRTQTGTAIFDVPAGATVAWVSFWNSGTFVARKQVTSEVFAGAGTYTLQNSTLTLANV